MRQGGFGFAQRTGLSAADLENELGGAFERTPCSAKIDTALEAVRCIRDKAVATGATGNRLRRKEGRFKEHLARVQRDATVFAAHDPGHRHRAFVVGDQQNVVLEVPASVH